MNREIKFRAWDINGEQFCDPISGEYIWNFNNKCEIEILGEIQIDSCPGGMYHEQHDEWRPIEVEIMQFTGLKDKNGVEIYEGDIVKCHYFIQVLGEGLGVMESEEEIIGEICFQQLGLWIQCEKEDDCGYLLWINGLHEESFEIIGNIHENPQLLNP